jgi:hypothetical protein
LIHEHAIRLRAFFFLGNPACLSLFDILFAAKKLKNYGAYVAAV